MSANQKLASTSTLAKAIQDRDLETKALDALEECLSAECRVYDIAQKELVVYADGKTRLGAAMGILAYSAGKPIERKEIITHNADSVEALMARVKSSPELLRRMIDMLVGAEKAVVSVPAQVVGNSA